MSMEKLPGFLKEKYGDLHTSEEVESAARRTEARTNAPVSERPADRIQNYLDRFNEILDRKKPDEKERGVEALKHLLHDKFVIKPEAVPEEAFLLEQRIARDLGHGDVEITEEFKKQKTEQIINNQTHSLDKWINYLSSPDAQYPDWAKYWAFRSMLEMGKLKKEEDKSGKETARFQKRTKDSVASFPPLNPRALALTIGTLRAHLEEKKKIEGDERGLSREEKQKLRKTRPPVENKSKKLSSVEFQKLLSTENFSKIYAQFLIEMPEYSTEGLQETRGRWITFPQGSDPTELVQSLEGHPLEWCIADFNTAQDYLGGGDMHLYYSINEAGEAAVPRLAIRMQGEEISEIRGIAPDQNFDPYIAPKLDEKLKEFGPRADSYKKKSADMKQLTEIGKKQEAGRSLSKEELVFLYEMDRSIEGFGYNRDPRIQEIILKRNIKEDAPIVLDCAPQEIAWNQSEITEKTKSYIGPLFPGAFKLPLEHIYIAFPERPVRKREVEVGIKSREELRTALEEKAGETRKFKVPDYSVDMFEKMEVSTTREHLALVQLTVRDLGFPEGATTAEIFGTENDVDKDGNPAPFTNGRMTKLGLELCPQDAGVYLRLANPNQPQGDYFLTVMKPITDRGGVPNVWGVRARVGGRWLGAHGAGPAYGWGAVDGLVFRSRKLES